MDGQKNFIVFQCYGYERVFHECAFALLSLSRVYGNNFPSGTQVWIYTDNPEWFDSFTNCPFPLKFRKLDEAIIRQWRGNINFVHRVKIELLKDFAQDREGNILYADTDVVFTFPIENIFSGIANGKKYMHIMEGKVSARSNPIFSKLDHHLRANPALKKDGTPMNELPMWNAGVLGFSSKEKNLLDEVLAFTDQEYPKFPKHVVEQFAFSVYFSNKEGIKAASPFILHYWNLKEAGEVLASFFEFFKGRSWNELVTYSGLIQIPALMQEKINFYQGRSLVGKMQKKKWTPAFVDWYELSKQL